MWYKIQSLSDKNFNKSQISRELGLDRGTVRRYLEMSEQAFQIHISNKNSMPKKLRAYYDHVLGMLEEYPYLSAAQIEDRLLEQYGDQLPKVHSKTVYNFVQAIRQEKGISKPKSGEDRYFEQRPPTNYGEEAQVDFGEHWMQKATGGRQKVYFMAVVLSRSRYKYAYFINKPFTSDLAIKAHQLAFEYMEGVPHKMLYDQDKVFIVDEHGGDVVLTQKFKRYIEMEACKVLFCRKADPQTKGKVENVVKYVKNSFLKGRKYHTIDHLNESAIKWLERTGNAKKHGSTKLIPEAEWQIEKRSLLPVKNGKVRYLTEVSRRSYKVRKDNTIAYRSNFYTLPTGTYQNRDSQVWVEATQDQLRIYDEQNKVLVAVHPICLLKGTLIRNNDHLRDKKSSLKQKEEQVIHLLDCDPLSKNYLQAIHKDKPRYYHDHLREMLNILGAYDVQVIKSAIGQCMSLQVYNAFDLKSMLEKIQQKQPIKLTEQLNPKVELPQQANMQPFKSNINTYELIMK